MVLIKAKRLPPRLPRPQGGPNTPNEAPSSPASAGFFVFRGGEAPASRPPLPHGRNWRLDLVLGL